jgi:hypothetical protein
MSTLNSGKTWRQVADLPNTFAITAGSGRYWLARTSEDCDGVTVQSMTEENGSLMSGRSRCAPGLDAAGGQLAMAVTSGTIWLWVGSRIALSQDSGETWSD